MSRDPALILLRSSWATHGPPNVLQAHLRRLRIDEVDRPAEQEFRAGCLLDGQRSQRLQEDQRRELWRFEGRKRLVEVEVFVQDGAQLLLAERQKQTRVDREHGRHHCRSTVLGKG